MMGGGGDDIRTMTADSHAIPYAPMLFCFAKDQAFIAFM